MQPRKLVAAVALALVSGQSANAASNIDAARQPTPEELNGVGFVIGTTAIDLSNFGFEFDTDTQGWQATLTQNLTVGTENDSAVEDDAFVLQAGSSFFWKADPIINYSFAIQDLGAPSNFTFSTSAPINPRASGPYSVRVEFAGSITDGGANGAGISARPHSVPTDSDGVPEIQAVTFSRNGGATLNSLEHDLGISESFAAGTGPYTLGNFDSVPGYVETEALRNIAAPGWNYWQIDLSFRGTGGRDAYALTGRAEITPISGNPVPVPAAIWLLGSAFGAMGVMGRRGKQA